MKAWLLSASIGMTLTAVGGGMFWWGRAGAKDGPAAPPAARPDYVAAEGVVEGARPEVALRPEVMGAIAAIHVQENADVTRGALLVELHNETQKQQVVLAEAEVGVARAEREVVRTSPRPEMLYLNAMAEKVAQLPRLPGIQEKAKELSAAKAKVAEQPEIAEFIKQLRAKFQPPKNVPPADADAQMQRVRDEIAKKIAQLPLPAMQERAKELAAAKAKVEVQPEVAEFVQQMRTQLQAKNAPPKPLPTPPRADVAAADARIAVAEARLQLARAELAKTRLVAPGNGRVLRVSAEPGELAGPASPQPLLLLADLSQRRVRAFVEELDAPRVRVGQRAVVTADGLPGKEFAGVVAVVLPRMGRRAPHSDAAGEYRDVYYREVLLDLDAADELPLNLRMQTRIYPH